MCGIAGAGLPRRILGGYLRSLRVGLFGFREVRTTAGIVAGVIDVAAFAALAAAAFLTGLGQAIAGLNRRLPPAVALVSVTPFVLLGADAAASPDGSSQTAATAG